MTLHQYLTELSANNNRPWFQSHRAEFDELRERWYADLDRFFAAASSWEPSAAWHNGKSASYRIYRDTRFSPDKTPYKTFFSARFEPTRLPEGAGWYIQAGLDRNNSGLFGGIWCPGSATLKKLRHAIVDNIEEFQEIINEPQLKKLYPSWCGPSLKTAPKGWPKDHPDIELLRLLNYGREYSVDPKFFADPAWPERASEILRPLKPLVDFLNYSITEDV